MDPRLPLVRRPSTTSRTTRWIFSLAALALIGVATAGWLAMRDPALPDSWNEVDLPLAGMH